MGKPPAGWYDNPEGPGERYWDGAAWTDRHRSDKKPLLKDPPGGCLIAIVVAFVLLFGVCMAGGGDDEPESRQERTEREQPPQEREERKGDASARLACEHFRNVARDVRDGVLTNLELRQKLQEVHGDAQSSGMSAIRLASRRMLSAHTSRDAEAFGEAVDDMDRACKFIDK